MVLNSCFNGSCCDISSGHYEIFMYILTLVMLQWVCCIRGRGQRASLSVFFMSLVGPPQQALKVITFSLPALLNILFLVITA